MKIQLIEEKVFFIFSIPNQHSTTPPKIPNNQKLIKVIQKNTSLKTQKFRSSGFKMMEKPSKRIVIDSKVNEKRSNFGCTFPPPSSCEEREIQLLEAEENVCKIRVEYESNLKRKGERARRAEVFAVQPMDFCKIQAVRFIISEMVKYRRLSLTTMSPSSVCITFVYAHPTSGEPPNL